MWEVGILGTAPAVGERRCRVFCINTGLMRPATR